MGAFDPHMQYTTKVYNTLGTNELGLSGFEHSSTKVHESFELLNGPGSSLQIINHSILNVKRMSQHTHTVVLTQQFY